MRGGKEERLRGREVERRGRRRGVEGRGRKRGEVKRR